MAPILQCPDCGTKHPLSQVPSRGAFACRGCGRVLEVPEAVGPRAQSASVPAPPAAPLAETRLPDERPRPVPIASATANPLAPARRVPDPAPAPAPGAATRVPPAADGAPVGSRMPRSAAVRPGVVLGPVPWWMRLLLWIVALPLSFLIVFLAARGLGFFTTNQLSDVFLADNAGRFWPVLRLLPFVALLTAACVQAGVYGLARLRSGRARGPRSANDFSPAGSRSRAR